MRSVDIARMMEVSPASVVHMMGVLSQGGFVRKRRYGQVQLTGEGIRTANRLYTKAALLEAFFLQELGVDDQIARRDAVSCLFALSEESIEHICCRALQKEAGNRLFCRRPGHDGKEPRQVWNRRESELSDSRRFCYTVRRKEAEQWNLSIGRRAAQDSPF